MTRIRLRHAHDRWDLVALYSKRYDPDKADHHRRFASSIDFINTGISGLGIRSAADLSCGNGRILQGVEVPEKTYGDLTPGWEITGPIEETIEQIPPVDLLICSETLEHLDDPDAVLAQIRSKAALVFISTPEGERNNENYEHYWGWESEDIEEMLRVAGFTDVVAHTIWGEDTDYYRFQYWLAR